MYYKALLHHYYTKRDNYGNVYHAVKITNPKNGKNFTTETPDISNITSILNKLFPESQIAGRSLYYITESCTNSARLSSLPDKLYLASCRPDDAWKKSLRLIGYRIPKID